MNALEPRQTVMGHGDEKMTTESKSLPVPVIHKPTGGSLVTHPAWIGGTTEVAGTVQVTLAGGSMLFEFRVDEGGGKWEGTLPKDLKGEVVITARLFRDNEFSSWAPERRFKVE
ncbi:hypothetical protein [Pseudomonas sp. LB1P83]